MRQENKPRTRLGDTVAGRGGGMGNPQVGEHSMLEEQPKRQGGQIIVNIPAKTAPQKPAGRMDVRIRSKNGNSEQA